jgi:uncharacterized RDD family membrane protein YckC
MMMLIAAIAIWLTLILFFVALCRGAASADGRGLTSTDGYPTAGAGVSADTAGLVLLENRPGDLPTPSAQDLRVRARGARGRAGQYAAGS